MPFDVRGRTRATLGIEIIALQRGIPSKLESSAQIDYVPALCTHRPSLPGTELLRELRGLTLRGLTALRCWKSL
uniref:Uncharacterized protein n=1 Tax=Strigamia maritima TaxID=126957 RepID=T1IU35_STRMM